MCSPFYTTSQAVSFCVKCKAVFITWEGLFMLLLLEFFHIHYMKPYVGIIVIIIGLLLCMNLSGLIWPHGHIDHFYDELECRWHPRPSHPTSGPAFTGVTVWSVTKHNRLATLFIVIPDYNSWNSWTEGWYNLYSTTVKSTVIQDKWTRIQAFYSRFH